MTMLILTFTWTLKMALSASETTKFGLPIKNWAIYMCIVPVLLELRKLFLAVDHGVPDDEVLLPPGDDV